MDNHLRIIGTDERDPWKPGIYFRGGDVVRPLNGQWFGPKYPTKYLHFFVPFRILPFISFKIGRFGMYCGFKVFGVDPEAYKNWLPVEEVYDGSVALCPSWRFTNG